MYCTHEAQKSKTMCVDNNWLEFTTEMNESQINKKILKFNVPPTIIIRRMCVYERGRNRNVSFTQLLSVMYWK